MLPFNSSISSSEQVRLTQCDGRVRYQRRVLRIVLWTIGSLIVIDIAVGAAFAPPIDPRRASTSLQTYFNYGRSIEGKLRRDVGSEPDQDAPIMKAGWLSNDCNRATLTSPRKRTF